MSYTSSSKNCATCEYFSCRREIKTSFFGSPSVEVTSNKGNYCVNDKDKRERYDGGSSCHHYKRWGMLELELEKRKQQEEEKKQKEQLERLNNQQKPRESAPVSAADREAERFNRKLESISYETQKLQREVHKIENWHAYYIERHVFKTILFTLLGMIPFFICLAIVAFHNNDAKYWIELGGSKDDEFYLLALERAKLFTTISLILLIIPAIIICIQILMFFKRREKNYQKALERKKVVEEEIYKLHEEYENLIIDSDKEKKR